MFLKFRKDTFGAAGRIRTCEPLRERISHSGAQVEEVYVYGSGLYMDKKLKDKFFQDLTSINNHKQRILHAKVRVFIRCTSMLIHVRAYIQTYMKTVYILTSEGSL